MKRNEKYILIVWMHHCCMWTPFWVNFFMVSMHSFFLLSDQSFWKRNQIGMVQIECSISITRVFVEKSLVQNLFVSEWLFNTFIHFLYRQLIRLKLTFFVSFFSVCMRWVTCSFSLVYVNWTPCAAFEPYVSRALYQDGINRNQIILLTKEMSAYKSTDEYWISIENDVIQIKLLNKFHFISIDLSGTFFFQI